MGHILSCTIRNIIAYRAIFIGPQAHTALRLQPREARNAWL